MNETGRRRTWIAVSLTIGIMLGLGAYHFFGPRYLLAKSGDGSPWRINTQTGEVWRLNCDPKPCHWEPVPESPLR